MKRDETGAYWGNGEDLTPVESRQRKRLLAKKPPYSLCIRTDSYVGNFERELVAFAVGILDSVQTSIGYGANYIKAFWNAAEGEPISSYEDYKTYLEQENNDPTTKSEQSILATINETIDEVSDDVRKIMGEIATAINARKTESEDEYAALYNDYLCNTYQVVDDWEQDTFYRIDDYFGGGSSCDSIYIQLNKPLDGRYENIIISRIIGFFEGNIYGIIHSYESVCNGWLPRKNEVCPKLISLELLDCNGNVVKNYSDWRAFYDRSGNN